MKTSRCVVFHGEGRPLTLETVPVPPLQRGEILVRNEYTTLCRSDLNTFSGKRTERTPTILGHEIVGRIEAMGPGAPERDARGVRLEPGCRVTWAIYASDPDSALARLGIPQKGAGLFKYGHEPITASNHLHGGLSEFCILRQHTPVVRLDRHVPLPVLALINCSVATVAGSLRLAGPVAGRNVLVTGAGMLGVIACAMCSVAGAGLVVAVDLDPVRLATAREFGAGATIQLGAQRPALPQAVASMGAPAPFLAGLDYSGIPGTMEALLASLGIGGTAVFIGATFPHRPIEVNAEALIRNVHTIRGLHNYNQEDLLAAVSFIEEQQGRFPFARLVHDGFDLAHAAEAFDEGLRSGAHRVGVRC
jgi:putative phosphonate catabolism associated alcohol dehydrogenase